MGVVNNLNNLVLDDQYFLDVPVPQGATSPPTGVVGLVGTAARGPMNVATLVTSYTDFVKKFEDVDQAFTLTGPITARNLFAQGNAQLYFVRAQSATTAAIPATAVLNDTAVTPKPVMTLTAKTPGTWGNSLTATVSAGTKLNTFKLSIQYGAEAESYDNLLIAQPATPIVGAVLASAALALSNLVTATFPVTPNLVAWATVTVALSAGTNGTTGILDADFIGTSNPKTGTYALDASPINYIAVAESTSTAINTGIQSNVNSITQNGGLPRKGVITFPQATQPSGLAALMQVLDDDRIIPAYGYQQVFDPISAKTQVASPLGFMLGVLAQLPPHYSPGNKRVNGTQGLDPTLVLSPGDLIICANNRVNAVGVTIPAGGLGIRGGFTSSQAGGDKSQVYVRNMKDYIVTSISSVGGQYVDIPITDDLMRQVKQSVDNILLPMKEANAPQDKMVADYRIQCDRSNNTDLSLAQNILICDIAVKLLNMNRFMVFRTQISSGVVISQQ